MEGPLLGGASGAVRGKRRNRVLKEGTEEVELLWNQDAHKKTAKLTESMERITNTCWLEHRYDHIPLDLWREIFSYLPVKFLLQFRSVSKTWRSIIDDPNFTFLHLKHFADNLSESHLIVQKIPKDGKYPTDGWALYRSIDFVEEASKIMEHSIAGKDIEPGFFHCVGSINGVFLIRLSSTKLWDEEYDAFLWNPSIRKIISIPPPVSTATLGYRPYVELRLGFDQSSNDYKVLAIFHDLSSEETHEPNVEIFSRNTRSWRKVVCPAQCVVGNDDKAVFVGGCIYWIGAEYLLDDVDIVTSLLVSFDLTSERFSYTRLLSGNPAIDASVVPVDDSSLGIAVWRTDLPASFVRIWVWQTGPLDGLTWNWTDWREIRLEGEIAYLIEYWKKVSFHPLETLDEKVAFRFKSRYFGGVDTYIESLALLTIGEP